jgi:hypothetical protein
VTWPHALFQRHVTGSTATRTSTIVAVAVAAAVL